MQKINFQTQGMPATCDWAQQHSESAFFGTPRIMNHSVYPSVLHPEWKGCVIWKVGHSHSYRHKLETVFDNLQFSSYLQKTQKFTTQRGQDEKNTEILDWQHAVYFGYIRYHGSIGPPIVGKFLHLNDLIGRCHDHFTHINHLLVALEALSLDTK